MADFRIKPDSAIWLGGRMYYAGDEDALEKAGFSEKQKRIKARNRTIVWPVDGSDDGKEIDATEPAKVFAREHSIDLATVVGTGAGGRILKRDVEQVLEED